MVANSFSSGNNLPSSLCMFWILLQRRISNRMLIIKPSPTISTQGTVLEDKSIEKGQSDIDKRGRYEQFLKGRTLEEGEGQGASNSTVPKVPAEKFNWAEHCEVQRKEYCGYGEGE